MPSGYLVFGNVGRVYYRRLKQDGSNDDAFEQRSSDFDGRFKGVVSDGAGGMFLASSDFVNTKVIRIKDDGKSFQVKTVMEARGTTRLGVLGMRERVEMVGGVFGIESVPGEGTTVRVEMPLKKTKAASPGKTRGPQPFLR